jgi:hypothetical protein
MGSFSMQWKKLGVVASACHLSYSGKPKKQEDSGLGWPGQKETRYLKI